MAARRGHRKIGDQAGLQGQARWGPEDTATRAPFPVSGLLSSYALERWFTKVRLTEKISQLLKPFYKVSGWPFNKAGELLRSIARCKSTDSSISQPLPVVSSQ